MDIQERLLTLIQIRNELKPKEELLVACAIPEYTGCAIFFDEQFHIINRDQKSFVSLPKYVFTIEHVHSFLSEIERTYIKGMLKAQQLAKCCKEALEEFETGII